MALTATGMKVSEALQAASDSLTEHNWNKGSYFVAKSGSVCMCVHGAIQAQVNGLVAKVLALNVPTKVAGRAAEDSASAAALAKAAAWAAGEAAKRAWPGSAAADAAVMATGWRGRPDWVRNASGDSDVSAHYIAGMVGLTASFNDQHSSTLEDVKAKLAQAVQIAKDLESKGEV